ncbi:MAG TPA: hypothetical protein VGW35_05510 [Methylomirabilota bacterium]|jgi:hypothetical protein|nr:hypothetical protein [Methylomirabilota bacterium]
MAGVVVGMIKSVDRERRVIIVGGTEFRVPNEIPLAGFIAGMSVTITYEVEGDTHTVTTIRANPPI